MVGIVLPIFVVYVLHEGVDKLGVVIAVATFFSYMLRIAFGYFSDRYGVVKPLLVVGYLISALSKPLLGVSHSYVSVAFLRAVERMGKAVRSAPKDALISAYATQGEDGKTFGFHKMMDIAGELSGAIIIFALFYFSVQEESLIRTVFFWTLLPGLTATAIVLVYVQDVPARPRETIVLINPKDYRLLGPLVLYFGFLFFLFSEQYFIVQAKALGFTLHTIPLLVIAYSLIQTLTSYYSGLLVDRFDMRVMLFIAFVFGLLSTVALYEEFLWSAFVFLGLFTVISLNAIRAYISKEAKNKGFVYGIFYGGVAISGAAGAVIVGQIWHHFGFDAALLYSLSGLGTLTVLAAILMLRTALKQKKR